MTAAGKDGHRRNSSSVAKDCYCEGLLLRRTAAGQDACWKDSCCERRLLGMRAARQDSCCEGGI